jgi:hypothetical protein
LTQENAVADQKVCDLAIPEARGFYTVESRFIDPRREAAWNDWYDGHVDGLLKHVPGFLSSQRFRKINGNGGEYFGLHTLLTGRVLLHPAYTARGGTFPLEWLPLIEDWYRGFYTGLDQYPEVDEAFILAVTDRTDAEVQVLGTNFKWVRGAALTPRAAQRGLATLARDEGITLGKRFPELIRVFAPITGLKRQH